MLVTVGGKVNYIDNISTQTPPTGHTHYSKFKKRNEKIWVLVLHIKTVNYWKHFHFSKAQYFFMLKADLNFDSSE